MEAGSRCRVALSRRFRPNPAARRGRRNDQLERGCREFQSDVGM